MLFQLTKLCGFWGVGAVQWTSDATIASHVWEFPLMTSVQQANYHPTLKRYIFANWAWISYDGNPRPDHTADERNDRTGHQRTQLSLVEVWGTPAALRHVWDTPCTTLCLGHNRCTTSFPWVCITPRMQGEGFVILSSVDVSCALCSA